MKSFLIVLVYLAIVQTYGFSLKSGEKVGKLQKSTQVTRDVAPRLTCSDFADGQGDGLVLIDYTPFISNYNFDNRASYCCFDGIWLLYGESNYNVQSLTSPSFFGWGENYCTNFDSKFDNQASSARFVGAPNGYKYDTLNIYQGENFSGLEKFTYNDKPSFSEGEFGRSVIITGCSPWTLYEFPNYQGNAVCLYPSSSSDCFPGFFPKAADLLGFSDKIGSAVHGCLLKNDEAHITPEFDGVHSKLL